MIIKYKKSFLSLTEIWFDDTNPKLCGALKFCLIRNSSKDNLSLPFYKKEKKCTLVHDLTIDEDTILSSFSKTTRYEIRKGIRQNISWKVNSVDIKDFIIMYNSMAEAKGLAKMPKERLLKYGLENLTFFSAYMDEKLIIIQVYIHNSNTTRLLYSTSVIHSDIEKNKIKFIGFANRMLHWETMKYFKNKKINIYDFGGYGNDKNNKRLAGIDKFKMSFNGEINYVYDYYSIPFRILRALRKTLS